MPKKKPGEPQPELETFATRLKYARDRAGLTQTALSERSGIDKTQINRWESQARGTGLTVEKLLKLAKALGQPVGWLAADEGQPAIPVIREQTDRRRRRPPPSAPKPNGDGDPGED